MIRSFMVALVALFGLAAHVASAENQNLHAGAVYTMTNQATGNFVVAYARQQNGFLTLVGAFPTGGLGSGDALGNQNGLVLSPNGTFLFAVNAGSHDVSVFRVESHQLVLTCRIASGGTRPISLALDKDVLYVLNAGGDGNISGFRVHQDGLVALPDSTRVLGGPGKAPAQISWARSGGVLIVTAKDTNEIITFVVDKHGLAGSAQVFSSEGQTPFGFAVDEAVLIVSEATTGGLSSYHIDDEGQLSVRSASVVNGQAAACWVVLTEDRRVAFTTNATSGTISSYEVEQDGTLVLHQAVAVSLSPGVIDMALTTEGRFLFVLNSGAHTIDALVVDHDGTLTYRSSVSGLSASANGLAAR